MCVDNKQLYLIFEYVERDLKYYLEALGKEYMEPLKVKKFLFQLLSGIADCHMKRVIHRDLKPANILIDKNGILKITQTFLKLGTLDSREPSPFPCALTRKRSSLSGTELLKSCWALSSTQLPSIFGRSAAFSPKWSPRRRSSRGIATSTSFTEYSESWGLPTTKFGLASPS